MTLRLGLLSTANINGKLLGGARAAEGVEVVAVASRDADRAEAYAAEHDLARAHGSYEALLADPDVDAVYVSLPNSLHVPWSVRALRAGKHVLCEKPLTRRPEEAQAVFDEAEQAGRVLAEGFMWRHHEQARRLRELVRDRVVGNVRLVRAAFSFHGIERAGDVRLQRALDGGGLMDVGCYCVSAMRLLVGEPERVTGRQILSHPTHGVDIRFAGTLSFAGHVLGVFDCGLDVVDRSELEVIGDAGSIFLADPWHSRETRIEVRRPEGTEVIEIPRADPYACELDDFAAAARGERPHPFGREDAVGQARTIAALYRSAEFGAEALP